MKNLFQYIENSLAPKINKLANQKHLLAIRQGLILTLPLTIVGSFFVVFMFLPIPGYENFIAPYRAALDIPNRFTVGILSILASGSIAYSLARIYNHPHLNPLTATLISISAFFVATVTPNVTKEYGRIISMSSLGSASLFGAIVVALITVEIYRFTTIKGLTIKMPEGVPQGIYDSFAAIIPTTIVITLFWVLKAIIGFDISATLTWIIRPIANFLGGNSLLGGLLVVFLITFFWSLGIHGPQILGPIIRPIWDAGIAENIDSFASGTPVDQLPNIFTEQFLQWFVWIGGAGVTLPLVILFMVSKSKALKQLGRLSFIPGIFNINEPMIFGAPIVMNPILAIPFILSSMVCTSIAYGFLKLGVIPMMMARLPFTFPAPIAAYISTDFTIMAAVVVIINFFVALVIYYPFFKSYEKTMLIDENKEIS